MSESGYRMVQHFFMSPRLDLAPNAFMLDMAYPSASKIIRNLQEKQSAAPTGPTTAGIIRQLGEKQRR